MARKKNEIKETSEDWQLYEAEAAYASSIVDQAMGDMDSSIAALRRSFKYKPDFAPTILSLGSVEYQLGNNAKGKKHFLSLLDIPDTSNDLWEILDKAGDYLIEIKKYKEGAKLYEGAIKRFPEHFELYQGLACCLGNQGFKDKAVIMSEKALALNPESKYLLNDLGWSLLDIGRLEEAELMLQRAIAIDNTYKLAIENLKFCQEKMSKSKSKISGKSTKPNKTKQQTKKPPKR